MERGRKGIWRDKEGRGGGVMKYNRGVDVEEFTSV
jgi:hypothetical protein